MASTTRRSHASEEFEDMLAIGIDAGEAFFAIGVSYEALRLQLKRREKLELAEKLKQWKAQDAERLKHAQGRGWL